MKRKRGDVVDCGHYDNKPFKKPRQRRAKAPRRAYTNSLVPLASRGYRINNVESKVFDVDTATYAVNTTGSFTLLNSPIQGTDMLNRIGRKIVVTSVYVRGRVQLDATGTLVANVSGSQLARMILFIDYQPNGNTPALTDVLKEANAMSQLKMNNRDRFKVIADKNYVFDGFVRVDTATQALAAFNRSIAFVKKYKKLALETIYNNGNAGTIADMNSGALYMLWVGDKAVGATDANAFISTRIRFKDP